MNYTGPFFRFDKAFQADYYLKITSAVGTVAFKTLLTGVESGINTVASSAINSVDGLALLDGIKSGDINTIMSGSWFDSEGFTKTMTDKRTWAGTASSMVAAGVTTGLTAANLGNGVNNMGNDFKDAAERNKALLNSADKVSGFNVGQINDMLSMNSFIGSMAGAGVTYAMTGNVSFNVLNASDLTGGKLQGGLLQMNLGKDGFSMEIGMGGTNVSAGVIASAMRGGQNWDKNTQIKRAAAANNMDVATALRSQWGYGDVNAKSQLDSIIRGDTKWKGIIKVQY